MLKTKFKSKTQVIKYIMNTLEEQFEDNPTDSIRDHAISLMEEWGLQAGDLLRGAPSNPYLENREHPDVANNVVFANCE